MSSSQVETRSRPSGSCTGRKCWSPRIEIHAHPCSGHYDIVYKIEPLDPISMNATGPFQRNQPIQEVDDTLLNDQYFEYLFPSSHCVPSQNRQPHYDHSSTDYNYQTQSSFPPDHTWDMSSMYRAQPLSMPHTPATPAYYPSSPDTYQQTPPPNVIPPTSSSSTIPSLCPTEPPIRHSEFSSAINGPGRVRHTNIPFDLRSFGTSVQGPLSEFGMANRIIAHRRVEPISQTQTSNQRRGILGTRNDRPDVVQKPSNSIKVHLSRRLEVHEDVTFGLSRPVATNEPRPGQDEDLNYQSDA